MQVKFDTLNRFEMPSFYLCNPGSVYLNGVITNIIGFIPDTTDEEMVLNFNTTSELNFRVTQVHRDDIDDDAYAKKIFSSIKNRRLIFVDGIGYFVISNVVDGYDGDVRYKDVRAESCEYEIGNRILPYIADGTYKFRDLLEKVVASLPVWTIGEVNLDVAEKHRTFEDVSVEQNALSFLLEDMQDAYECIFGFNIIKRTINVYDQNNYVKKTSVHLTKDDWVNSIEITENSDELYTALSVQGDSNLNISPVNPLGTNVIYNFDYYIDWMTPRLSEKVSAWQALVKSKEQEYYDLNLQYYERLSEKSNMQSEVEMLETQKSMYQRCRDNVVAEGSTVTVESYNDIIKANGGVPVGVQNEIAATVAEIENLIKNVDAELASANNGMATITASLDALSGKITEINNSIKIVDYFTDEEYSELSNYIFEGNYTDEYITVTDSMTYQERFQQMKTLFDRATTQLIKVSSPTQEFSMDVENYIFCKEFEAMSEQLETGCLINVEIEIGDVAELFLTNITVNYADESLSMTFGNRFNRFDPKALFGSVLGDIKRSANSISYVKEILYPVKTGVFDVMRDAIESSGILTKEAVMASSNQEILIDDTGILGRKMLADGGYDPKQIKITNQTIVFTDDAWRTARTALGNFLFNNPVTGEVEERYGIIADTLVGSLVLSEEVGIYNTDNSITLDKNGFTLTADYTGNSESKNVFTIQKVVLDNDGNPYYDKQLYMDDDGNVILNGSISIFTDSGSTSLNGIASNVKDLEDVDDELADLQSSIDKNTSDLYDALTKESSDIKSVIDDKIANVNANTSNEVAKITNTINQKYNSVMSDVSATLENYKAAQEQYMIYGENGLTLGAATSEFKTVIDNSGMYFREGNTIVSYVSNRQLHIPNAVIESTLTLGKFFFSPRNDGGVSLTWQG